MDAVEFLNVRNRMCNSNSLCDKCILFDKNTFVCEMKKTCIDVEETVAKVEKWVKENPVKTRASEFLKICPQASVDDNGIPKISPCVADEIRYNSRTCDGSCTLCRYDFWQEEIE